MMHCRNVYKNKVYTPVLGIFLYPPISYTSFPSCFMVVGDNRILSKICEMFPFPSDGRVLDHLGQTPMHLVLKAACNDVSIQACIILHPHNIDR